MMKNTSTAEEEVSLNANLSNLYPNVSFSRDDSLLGVGAVFSNQTAIFVYRSTIVYLLPIVAYSVMFMVAAFGNLTVFVALLRAQRKSRVGLLLTHLTVADLIVAFFMIPLEIIWRITNQWLAGNAVCKLFMVIRAFGPYLSSNVIICIALDRYFVIMHPLRINDAMRRGKIMLTIAWIFSFLCASPQSLVFRILQHPDDPNFHQCVSFGSFPSPTDEMLYNVFCLAAMYFVPLSVIIFSYSCILFEISTRSRENQDGRDEPMEDAEGGKIRLRKSDWSTVERARLKILKMTITIVSAFLLCWTPYTVMSLWYMFDHHSAQKVDKQVQEFLFLMAVSNSCLNPLVYGSYVLNLKPTCRCFCFGNFRKKKRSMNTKRNSVDEGTAAEVTSQQERITQVSQ